MNNHEGHIKLWDELARTGEESKRRAFERIFDKDTPVPADYCFACQECNERGDMKGCSQCPLSNNDAGCLDGLFDDWCSAEAPEERSRLASIIRDLPWEVKP